VTITISYRESISLSKTVYIFYRAFGHLSTEFLYVFQRNIIRISVEKYILEKYAQPKEILTTSHEFHTNTAFNC